MRATKKQVEGRKPNLRFAMCMLFMLMDQYHIHALLSCLIEDYTVYIKFKGYNVSHSPETHGPRPPLHIAICLSK
jgi:hypothetical protein